METSISNKCKSFTSLEQSKKLAEILPIESADMHYSTWTILDGEFIVSQNQGDTIKSLQEDYGNQIIPCWSLSALLDVLPKQFGRYTKSLCWFDDAWHCVYMDEDSECKYCVSADNPLDACYEMILKLHELDLV